MTRLSLIAVGGFQHETNTFAPSKADYAAFEDGGGWPPLVRGDDIAPRLQGANIPAAGAIDALHALGHRTAGLVWGAASPSAHVTRDAFERIVGDMLARLAALGPVDGVYLDLHGAMVTEHLDDGEGELLARVRKVVGPRVPVVASLDLHANVTRAMFERADGLVAYRTYPHVDMAATGERAAHLLESHARGRERAGEIVARARFPDRAAVAMHVDRAGKGPLPHAGAPRARASLRAVVHARLSDGGFSGMRHGGVGLWHRRGARADGDCRARRTRSPTPKANSRWSCSSPTRPSCGAMQRGEPGAPVVLADTQDNPGAGGNGDTTGLLAALLARRARSRCWGC